MMIIGIISLILNKNREYNNNIFIGDKPSINYATSVVMNFTTKNVDQVIIKSRGKFISKAVDVSQIAINRFLKDQAVPVGRAAAGQIQARGLVGSRAGLPWV